MKCLNSHRLLYDSGCFIILLNMTLHRIINALVNIFKAEQIKFNETIGFENQIGRCKLEMLTFSVRTTQLNGITAKQTIDQMGTTRAFQSGKRSGKIFTSQYFAASEWLQQYFPLSFSLKTVQD